MYLVGLTGGIAAGKSTVAKRWVEHGAFEIDADQLARDVVAAGTEGAERIREQFGQEVFAVDGSLDRAKLGSIVFGDADLRKQLEAIVHPLVKARAKALVESLPESTIAIYNVPLLVEASVDLPFDLVVTVEAPAKEQIDRLRKYRGMTEAEATKRVASQASPAQRANAADVILNSNQELPLLIKDADSLWLRIQREAFEKHSA
ncbi:MAG: dephospho-CoA kinase [Rhodoluna sp.]